MGERLVSKSPKQTFSGGKDFAGPLVAGDVVALSGPMGSGKTVFTQGIASGLGVTDVVNSPTFKLVGEYDSDPPVYHFDFYRIKSTVDLATLGLDHYFGGKGICVIEWSDLFPDVIPWWAIRVFFNRIGEGEREISIERNEPETVSN
ncbi:MAG: tRNA (adenosine(37)-N6)-threonylcarbamoyltransferase complex ATPase subunit type 1 TsaE [Dehalococcoidia bacterium]|nr:tRNA (adenosine(37)-N6)-threonylcarbamoyltransferase complex ATPase subunit type 1 TsaE [Dehalococcoidia bacterium]